jgi:hypothetical protein
MKNVILLERFHVVPRCTKCGSDDLGMPDGITSQDDLTDDSLITCGACGATFTYTQVVKAAETAKANDLANSSDGPIG